MSIEDEIAAAEATVTGSNKTKIAQQLNASLQTRLDAADAAYRQQYGKPLPITSTIRSREKQAELYANRATNPYPVAAPGASTHQIGTGVDIDSSVPDSFLNDYGLYKPFKNDPVHVQAMPNLNRKQEAKIAGFSFGPQTESYFQKPTTLQTAPTNVPQDQSFESQLAEAEKTVSPESNIPEPSTIKDFTKKYLSPVVTYPAEAVRGVYQGGANLVSGAFGSMVAGPARFYYGLAKGETPRQAAKAEEQTAAAFTYQPRNESGKLVAEYNPVALVGKGLAWTGGKLGDVTQQAATELGAPLPVAATIGGVTDVGSQFAAAELAGRAISGGGKAKEPVMGQSAPAGATSVGAAETAKATELQQLLAQASPQLRKQLLERNIPLSEVNLEAVRNIVKADSLPDNSIQLSAGEAAQHSGMLSEEFNLRGGSKGEENRRRMDNNQQALINNMQLIRHEAAPDVHSTSMLDAGKNIIDEYKKLDEQKNKEINAASKELEDAAGSSGYDLQVDPESIYTNIQKVLKTKGLRKTAEGMLEDLKQYVDEKSMTFEEYLNVRKNLSTTAGTSKDGNVRTAAGLAIKEMDKLPLKGETAQLKVLADKLRSTAKERFDQIKNDPAYADAIEDMAPVDFFNKHILGNKQPKNLQKIIDTFGEGSKVHQEMTSGLMHYLSEKSGAAKGTFLQDTYNNALRSLDNKDVLPRIINPKSLNDLQNLGDVSALLKRRTASDYRNLAGTATALQSMAEGAVALGERAGNIATQMHGVPLEGGTIVRKSVSAVKKVLKKTPEDIFYKKALQPGAGASLKDISQIGSK